MTTPAPTNTGAEPKPRPHPIDTTRPYWDGLAQEQVRLQHCGHCGAWIFYPRVRCPVCLSDQLGWEAVSGRGVLYTYTVARQATHPAFADEVPQVLAVVELDEGTRLTTTLVDVDPAALVPGADPGALRIGARVEPVFDHGEDGTTLLRHRLVG